MQVAALELDANAARIDLEQAQANVAEARLELRQAELMQEVGGLPALSFRTARFEGQLDRMLGTVLEDRSKVAVARAELREAEADHASTVAWNDDE